MAQTLEKPTSTPGGTTPPPPRGRSTTLPGIVAKILGLGTVAAVVVWLGPVLIATERWFGLAVLLVAALLLFAVYSTKRFVPGKYLVPGTLLLVAMVVYPIVQTVQLSFTNFGDGKRVTKEEAIATIVGSSVQQVDGSTLYDLSVGTTGTATDGPFVFFLVDPETGDTFAGDAEGLEPLDGATVEDDRITEVSGYTILTPREVNDAGAAIQDFTVPTDGGAIRAQGVNSAFEGVTTLQYDEATDTITDTSTDTVYEIGLVGDSEYFVGEDGRPAFAQSWIQNVGVNNYERVVTSETILSSFARIFAWTLAFAFLSVALCFALGLGLAVVLNDARLKGQRIYRSLLLLPYATPGVIAILIWSNFYNRDFGLINTTLGLDVNWLGDVWLAKVAVLITNLWMGFPYMFVVATGALQSVPAELKEAATMDGANPFVAFRKVVLPLLFVAVAPLLVASFAFNFNNFNMIQLLTEGGPFRSDNPTAGYTDILISYTFRLAFGGSGAQFGFAAAMSVLLFIITAVIASIQFRATRTLEDVN